MSEVVFTNSLICKLPFSSELTIITLHFIQYYTCKILRENEKLVEWDQATVDSEFCVSILFELFNRRLSNFKSIFKETCIT